MRCPWYKQLICAVALWCLVPFWFAALWWDFYIGRKLRRRA